MVPKSAKMAPKRPPNAAKMGSWLDFGSFLGVKIDYVGLRRGSEPQLEAGKKDVENCWKLRRAKKWRG